MKTDSLSCVDHPVNRRGTRSQLSYVNTGRSVLTSPLWTDATHAASGSQYPVPFCIGAGPFSPQRKQHGENHRADEQANQAEGRQATEDAE